MQHILNFIILSFAYLPPLHLNYPHCRFISSLRYALYWKMYVRRFESFCKSIFIRTADSGLNAEGMEGRRTFERCILLYLRVNCKISIIPLVNLCRRWLHTHTPYWCSFACLKELSTICVQLSNIWKVIYPLFLAAPLIFLIFKRNSWQVVKVNQKKKKNKYMVEINY